jgi:hypothetical protein
MVGRRFLMGMILLMSMSVVQVQGAGQDSPSIELLEFLGEWETQEGQWVDPAEFNDMVLPDEEQENDEQKSEEKRDS